MWKWMWPLKGGREEEKMNSKAAEMASHSGPSKTPSEMRIILLGYKGSGKSSSGNTILGSEQFSLEKTGQCEKRQGDVGGRQVTVVNTPGWYYVHSLNETSELIKQEIVLSASLCPQGPDALLLVMRAGTSLTADWYKNMEEHVQLLSQTVWSHTMILFTHGDCLGGKSIEQYIESEGEGLQRLVKKCGNRYHVFNNKNRGDDTQVTQLLLKIEEVAGDKGGCFEIDRRVLEETEKKRRTQDEGAARRQMKVKKQRESIRSKMGDDLHLSEMRIILLGPNDSGKRTSGNTILGSEQFSLVDTVQCEKRQGDVGGRQVTVVDTPPWSCNASLNETPELIKQEIVLSASLCPPGPHGVLLFMRANCSRTADWYKNIEDHMQLLSQTVWSHTMMLFTHGDCLRGKSIEQYIESEGEGLQRLVELCGNRYHLFNNENRGDDTQVTELLLKIEEMDHYGTGRPATPDTKPKAVENSPVPAKPKAVAASVPAQSKGTASCVPELKKRQCEVLFDYASQHEDELELKVGDIIDFIRDIEAGWWFGSLNGKVGVFPDNFVKELEASGGETDTSLSLDVTQNTIKEMKKSQHKVNQDVQDQMQKMKSELHEKINLRQTEAGMKRTSLSLDTLRNTKEIEDCKRRQHQLDQDQQELRNQHPVLVGRVKNLAAQFEESQRELEKIRQRQTEEENKLTSLALDVTQKSTIKDQQQQQKVIQDLQDQINKITDQMQKMQCDMQMLVQRQTEADQKRASEARQNLTHGEAAKKLLSVREQLIQRISESTLHSLLDKLLTKSVITDDEMDAAKGEKVRVEKARHVIDLVRRKGDEASSFMIDMISQLDRNLSDLLQLKPSPTD